MSKLSVSDLQ
jgi:hypothetical protein